MRYSFLNVFLPLSFSILGLLQPQAMKAQPFDQSVDQTSDQFVDQPVPQISPPKILSPQVNPEINPVVKSFQPKATASARATQLQDQIQNIQPEKYDLSRYPVIDKNKRHWQIVLWATGILEPQNDYVAIALDGILSLTTAPKLSDAQKATIDAAMQVGTQLYLRNPSLYANIGQKLQLTIDYSFDPQWVAIALATLAKSGLSPSQTQLSIRRIQQRLPNWAKDVSLYTTIRNIAESQSPSVMPPLADLLNWQIVRQQSHLYVLCRPNRDILCLAVLKDKNGEFIQQNRQLWSVPLLLQSIHGLDWNFVRGQTPQGVYRIEGTVPQPDDSVFRAYGQFPLVKLFAPFEGGVREFIPGKKGKFTGNLLAYQTLLPPAWQSYSPMLQSYWAGKIGRSLFRIHGSGEAIDFFKGKANKASAIANNWNPALGCLSALELYDGNGNLLQTDMPKILNALSVASGRKLEGYLVVIDVPSKSGEPISLAEINNAIRSGN